MKIRHSSKSFKSKSPKSTTTSPSDNLLFSPRELKQMHYDKKRSKIIKITITCLLVAIIGMSAYAGSVWYEQHNKMIVLKAAIAKHQAELQVLEKAAALGAQTQQKQQQQQCQTAKQQLATDQASLSSDQQQYVSNQQELASAEQQLSTDGPLLIPYTQKLIQAIQNDISSDQGLIASVQGAVNQDQNFISQLGCN
jgi:hypothetical protein